MSKRPQLPHAPTPLTGSETVRIGVDGIPMLATLDEVAARVTAASVEAARREISARQLILSGTLVLPAALSLLTGKTTRVVTVPGLRVGDSVSTTAKTGMPAGVALAETYCAADGVLTIALVMVSTVSIGTRQEIPLTVAVLRPSAS